MRLHKLWVGNFKNLRDVTIDFDNESPTTVLVGRNGTGKSNILEALTIIFRDLDLGHIPPFQFKLSYACRGHEVKVEVDPLNMLHTSVRIDSESISGRSINRFVYDRLCT